MTSWSQHTGSAENASTAPLKVLWLDHSVQDYQHLMTYLLQQDLAFEPHHVTQTAAFLTALEKEHYDLIVSDLSPFLSGDPAIIKIVRTVTKNTPFILLVNLDQEDQALALLQLGIADYVVKEKFERLFPVVHRALHEHEERAERMIVERALAESEERLRVAIEAANVGIWHSDLIKGTETQDASLNRILGLPPVETTLPSGDFLDHIYPEDREMIKMATLSALNGNGQYQIQHRIIRPDGQVRWLSDRGKVFCDKSGKPIYMTGAATDITEQKENEKRVSDLLAREQERTARMVQLSETALKLNSSLSIEKILDIMTEELRRLIPSHHVLASLSFDQAGFMYATSVSDKYASDYLHNDPPVIEAHYPLFSQLKDSFRLKKEEARYHPLWDILSKDYKGALVNGYLGFPFIGRDGRHLGFVQLSDRKTDDYTAEDEAVLAQLTAVASTAIENARLYRERIEADQRKDTFLANMSHEIRTPMNAIIGLSNILSMSSPLTPQQKNYVETLQFSAKSLMKLLNDMLDIAKIEKSGLELEHISFRFADMIPHIIDLFAGDAQEKNITLSSQLGTEKDLGFIGDPTRIQQILLNLLSNALKFTEQGSITLNLRVEPEPDNTRSIVKLSVTDTGIGIPEHMQDAIFEKFTQADASTTRKYGGTGLGLSICRDLARMMGGDIAVKSQVGQGSEFTLTLPLEREESDILQKKPAANLLEKTDSVRPQQVPQILLVEDHEANILVATTMLEQLGYDCVVARNGEEAVEQVKAMHSRLRMVFLDIQIPGMDGFEVARHIRDFEEEFKLQPLQIIAITAHAMTGDREKCLAQGMNDYLAKPFNQNQLKQKLEECFDGHQS